MGREALRDVFPEDSGNRAEFFFFQAEDGIRDIGVTGVQTCALPILGDDPDAAFDLPLVVVDVEAGDGKLSTRRYHRAVDHLHGRRLAGPVRAQKTETLSTENLEVDALDRLEARVALLQTPRLQGRLPRECSPGSLRLRVQPPTSQCSRKRSPVPTPLTAARVSDHARAKKDLGNGTYTTVSRPSDQCPGTRALKDCTSSHAPCHRRR